jgi:DNA-binding CsgD family transcriptional regulator
VTVSAAEGLVGRAGELALASEAIRELVAGSASVLVIEGEAGIGKTRLVQRIVEEARLAGATVAAGQAHPFERTRPFGLVAAVLGLSRRSPDPRRAAIGELLAGEPSGPPVGAGDRQYRIIEAIVDLVEVSCAEHPVLLVAEDLHWADEPSLSAILTLTRQLPLAPLLIVVTARPSPLPNEVGRFLDDVVAGGARTLALQPLTSDEVDRLARQVIGGVPGPALTAMLEKAGGNPLWVVAMLRSLVDGGWLRRDGDTVEPTTYELPASLGDLVVRRLRHLSTATLELLEITAVLGDAVSLRDVATVARRPASAVVGLLRDAFDAQLLDEADDRVVFRHQLVHDAIYQHVPAAARRLLHREAAGALMAAGADHLAVAEHLRLGAERGDDEAVAWLRAAATEASAHAPMVTVDLLRHAETLLPDGHPDADVVAAELIGALLRAGQVTEASTRAEAVLARPHPAALDTPVRLALVGSLALQNRATELIAVTQVSLDAADLEPWEQVPMLAQQSWARTYTGDPQGGESAARRALAIAEAAGVPAMTVWALTALLVAVGRQGRFGEALVHARRAAALAEASHDARSLPLEPKLFLGLTLFDCDLVDDARTAFRSALDAASSGWWRSEALMADAEASFALGQWDDADPAFVAGGQVAQEQDRQLLVAQAMAYRTLIATGRGDLALAGELAAAIDPAVRVGDPSYNEGVLAFAVAGLAEARGDAQAVFDVLLRCWRLDAARENRYYHRSLAPGLVRSALSLGQRDVAAEVASVVADGVALAPDVPTVRSLALRCEGLVHGEIEPLVEAVALARGTSLVVEHAGACEDAATLLARDGRRREAADVLTEALERYEAAGAEGWARRVRGRLRDLGVHPGRRGPRARPTHGWESLTATEQAVSRLVAEGLTNGAVARRLYISPHTVNTHLRHVFAKLDVPNRVALAAVVHRSSE